MKNYRIVKQYGFFYIEEETEIKVPNFNFLSRNFPKFFKVKFKKITDWKKVEGNPNELGLFEILKPAKFTTLEEAQNFIKTVKPEYYDVSKELSAYFKEWGDNFIPSIINKKTEMIELINNCKNYNPNKFKHLTRTRFKILLEEYCNNKGLTFIDQIFVTSKKEIYQANEYILIKNPTSDLIGFNESNYNVIDTGKIKILSNFAIHCKDSENFIIPTRLFTSFLNK